MTFRLLSRLKYRWHRRTNARARRDDSCRHFAAQVLVLEERRLLSADPVMPTSTVPGNDLSKLLFVGNSAVGNVPVKQISLTNNSSHTIYPFLYDPNTGQSTAGGFYDPFDAHKQEYRAYIGYTKGGTNFLGLAAGDSITISVPLVFWDSGRAAIGTDPANMLPADKNTNKNNEKDNPFHFFYKNLDGTDTDRAIVKPDASSHGNGLIMYYHCKDDAVDPGADAPDQLLEFTIRDQNFLSKLPNIDPSQLLTLINYDVSYVDHLLAPIAMEATQVPVPNTSVLKDYGWIGAQSNYLGANGLQEAIVEFAGNTPANGLGTYFDGRGWPTFFNPNYSTANPSVGLRIPGGANIFFDSPLAAKTSSYTTPFGPGNHWMLTSGGLRPVQYSQTGNIAQDTRVIQLNQFSDTSFLSQVATGEWLVTTAEDRNTVLGTVASVDINNKTVTLQGVSGLPAGAIRTFIFFTPITDPYATRLRDLWYSWAQYYTDLYTNFSPVQIQGTVSDPDHRILTLDSAHPELALGMRVNGPGIAAGTLTTILKISDDHKTISLSAPTSGAGGTFTFSKPETIAFDSEATGKFPLTFTTPADQATAALFAGAVYEVLSVFSTAPRQVPALSGSMELMGNSIGGNVGFLPTKKIVAISADVRDVLKSALRGVYNFSKVSESQWYPDPSTPTGGRTYNVFNLDPYVWFVHKQLGLSGYGFSFDDDTADVGANGTSTLSITFAGLKGLDNPFEWAPSAQWGTVSAMATISQVGGQTILAIQPSDRDIYFQVTADDPANAVVGAYVWGNNIPRGTRLVGFGLLNQLQFVLSGTVPATTHPIKVTFTGRLIAPTGFKRR